MLINKWLIHKLGGFAKEDILPPPRYIVETPKIETLRTCFIDTNMDIPEEYIMDRLAHNFLPMIRENMEVTKERKYNGEVIYRAEMLIVNKE